MLLLPERANVSAKKRFHGLESTNQGFLHVGRIRFLSCGIIIGDFHRPG